MIFTPIEEVTSGIVNARNIYSSSGAILLKKNIPLTVGIIVKLRELGVTGIYVKDERFADIDFEDNVSDEVKIDTLSSLSDLIRLMKSKQKVDLNKLLNNVTSIVEEILKNKDILASITDIRTKENHKLVHAVNVCILSATVATSLKIKDSFIKYLAVASLVHEIIDPLELSSSKVNINEESKLILKFYHGLIKKVPKKVSISNIFYPPYEIHQNIHKTCAELLTAVSYYDSLISPFSDYQTYLPHEACECVMGLSEKVYAQSIVKHFLRTVSIYPNGFAVKLSTGETGIVAKQNVTIPMRPVIRIMQGEGSVNESTTMNEKDLTKEITVFIKKIIT